MVFLQDYNRITAQTRRFHPDIQKALRRVRNPQLYYFSCISKPTTLFRARLIQFRTFHSVSLRLILTLFSFTSVKYAFLILPQSAVFSGHFIVLQFVTLYKSIWWGEHTIQHLIIQFCLSFFFSFLFGPITLLSTTFPYTLHLCRSFGVKQVSHPYW